MGVFDGACVQGKSAFEAGSSGQCLHLCRARSKHHQIQTVFKDKPEPNATVSPGVLQKVTLKLNTEHIAHEDIAHEDPARLHIHLKGSAKLGGSLHDQVPSARS